MASLIELEKPDIFLSQIEMTPSGGQVYDQFYWFNTSLASLSKTVIFPSTGTYRFDLSAYAVAGSPSVTVLIDGVSKGTLSWTGTAISIKSLNVGCVTVGSHTVMIRINNFSGSSHIRVGLLYFTNSTRATPYVFPVLGPKTLSTGFLQKEDFGSRKLRGFNLSSNNLVLADLTAMKATGANVARCFVQVERLGGGDSYTLKSGELTKLDNALTNAASLGYYLIPSLFLDPTFNKDIWGTTASAIARRLSIQNLWVFLATRYATNTRVAAYDLWNEPRSNFNYAEVIRWQSSMVEAIRAVDNNHVIAIECISNDMWAMMLPLGYDNIIYSPHGYSTTKITHQGVVGAGTTRNKYPTLVSSADLAAPWGITELSKQHDDVRTMANRFNVPIFIGEFSCINWAPLNDASEWTSTKWTSDNISLIETEHWSWVYHAWREYEGWDSEIPSSFYLPYTYTNAKPSGFSSTQQRAARTGTAPTVTMLKTYFALNV